MDFVRRQWQISMVGSLGVHDDLLSLHFLCDSRLATDDFSERTSDARADSC